MLRRIRAFMAKWGDARSTSFIHRVAHAGVWAFLMRGSVRGAQLIRTVILARLLFPEDFGLMAMATITIVIVENLSRTGFRQALVQRDEEIDEYLDTAWTVEVVRGVFLSALIVLGAPLIGLAFGSEAAVPVIRVVAVSVGINGFTNLALVTFDRQLEFKGLYRFEVTQRVTEVIVGITAALILRSVWALVIGLLAGSVARVIASFVLIRRRPRFEFDRKKARELQSYAKWIYGSHALGVVGSEVDDVVVGRVLGEASLGLYRMAFTLSQAVVTEIAQTTNQVVFSAVSRLKGSGSGLREGSAQTVHFIAFLAFPVSVGIALMGEELTRVLLGEQWLGMVPALRVLAIAGAVRTMRAVFGVLSEGAGRPEVATGSGFLKLTLLVIVIYPAIRLYGLVGAAFAVLATEIIATTTLVIRARFLAEGDYGIFARGMGWPVVNSLVMGAAVFAVGESVGDAGVVGLLLSVLTGMAAYGLVVMLASRFFSYGAPQELLRRLRMS